MSWTAQAEALGEELREVGYEVAGVNAAAWTARVDPAATQGLVAAALALGAPPGALYPSGRGLRDDAQMLATTADLEATAGEMLKRARDMWAAAEEDLEAAQTAAAAALAVLSTSQNDRDLGAARVNLSAAQARIADCECTLDLLGPICNCLDYARTALSRVPDDLATTYETPYGHIRGGGVLPYSGDFLTGWPPTGEPATTEEEVSPR